MFKAWGLIGAALLIACSAAAAALGGGGVGGSGAVPWLGDPQAAIAAADAGTTIPLARFTRQASKDGKLYAQIIVGRSPFWTRKFTVTIPVLVVPLIVRIGSAVFDPTAADACIPGGATPLAAFLASPLVNDVAFDGGSGAGHAALINGTNGDVTTFIDAFRRAEWWRTLHGTAYHVAFKVTVAPAWTISAAAVQSLGGGAVIDTQCAPLGVLRTAAFQNYISGTVVPGVSQITPQTFVLFLAKDVVTTDGAALDCEVFCEIGYHGAVGSPVKTFAVAEYDTTSGFWNAAGITNISIVAHEIAEWLDDPLVTNPSPPWGNIGQVSGCQANWEAGDPLTGTDFPPITMGGPIRYDPQELVFHGWFYNKDGVVSRAAGAKYSMNGTFVGPAQPCPPGGTF